MPRPTTFPEKLLIRFSEGTSGRIAAVLSGEETVTSLIRDTVEQELERRERAAAKAPKPKRGRRAA